VIVTMTDFGEYQTRSKSGYENVRGDSGDSVLYPDGALVRGPKALCELQGCLCDAWLRMAEIYDEFDNKRTRQQAAKEGGNPVQEIQRSILG
jgi:hypothetical protein